MNSDNTGVLSSENFHWQLKMTYKNKKSNFVENCEIFYKDLLIDFTPFVISGMVLQTEATER